MAIEIHTFRNSGLVKFHHFSHTNEHARTISANKRLIFRQWLSVWTNEVGPNHIEPLRNIFSTVGEIPPYPIVGRCPSRIFTFGQDCDYCLEIRLC